MKTQIPQFCRNTYSSRPNLTLPIYSSGMSITRQNGRMIAPSPGQSTYFQSLVWIGFKPKLSPCFPSVYQKRQKMSSKLFHPFVWSNKLLKQIFPFPVWTILTISCNYFFIVAKMQGMVEMLDLSILIRTSQVWTEQSYLKICVTLGSMQMRNKTVNSGTMFLLQPLCKALLALKPKGG